MSETLSVRELAKKFKMTEKNLKNLINEHHIAHQVVRGKVMVNVRAFESWMASNLKSLSSEKLETIEVDEKNRALRILPMITEDRLVLNPPDLTKKDILTRLVDALVVSGGIQKSDFKKVLKAIIDRERLCSTAVMDGVAIPHPRHSLEDLLTEPLLVLAISPRGIYFEADDGKPTHLFFLICADRTDIHLKVMARLSRLLRSAKFRHELTISKDYSEVVEVFKKWEKKLKTTESSQSEEL